MTRQVLVRNDRDEILKVRSVRKLVDVVEKRYSNVSILILLVHTIMEAVTIAFYVWRSQVSRATTVYEFHWTTPVLIVQVVFSVLFFVEWVVVLVVEAEKVPYLLSWLTVVNLLTTVPMITVGIGSLVNPAWRSGWVPMYLRVWWLNECLSKLLDYPQFSRYMTDLSLDMTRYLIGMFSVTCTCIGTHQIVESCSGSYMDIFNSTYTMVVAFATVGYGDVTPTTTPARLFMVVFMTIGVCYIVPLFQKLASIAKEHLMYDWHSSRRGRNPHVIFAGELAPVETELVLRNLFAGWRKYIDLTVLILTPQQPPTETMLLLSSSMYKDRVKLLVGDPMKQEDLRRCDAKYAEAIFLFGNAATSSHFSDYTVVKQSMRISRFDPQLPQHIIIHQDRNTRLVMPYAASVLESERVLHNLLGLGVVLPGMIPLVVNLLRTYEPLPSDVTASENWVEQYEASLRNDLFFVRVPGAVRQLPFLAVADHFYRHNVVLMGVITRSRKVVFNPTHGVRNARKLVLIAKTLRCAMAAVNAVEQQLLHEGAEVSWAPSSTTTGGSGMLNSSTSRPSTGQAPYGHPKRCTRSSTAEVQRDISGDVEEVDVVSAVSRGGGVRAFQHIEDAYDEENHFVIIDMSAAQPAPDVTAEAMEEVFMSKSVDLYNVIRPILQTYPMSSIVLLTKDLTYSAYFQRLWSQSASVYPVAVVDGCGLSEFDLRRCNIKNSRGVVVFTAGGLSDRDTSAMTLLVNLSIVHLLGPIKSVPVVTEITDLNYLSLFPPHAEDPRICRKAEVDFAFETNYIVGHVLCRSMLYLMLERTYFAEEFVDVMDVLISGRDERTPSVARVELCVCTEPLATYGDVVRYCLGLGYLPLGLQRRITDSLNPSVDRQRLLLTNPPLELEVSQNTDVVYYLLPT